MSCEYESRHQLFCFHRILLFHSHDRKRAPTSHRESQSVYIPPAKRLDTRSSSSDSYDHSEHRGRRSREHDEREGRGRHRRHGRGGTGGRCRAHHEPDYVKNPSKWTKYDLKEDGSQVLRGMNQDQVNKYAAFQFLDEIKKRKVTSSLTEHDDETVTEGSDNSAETTKVVFKKPSKGASRTGQQGRAEGVRSEDGTLEMRGQEGHSGGGLKMAEYVVGSKAAAQLHRVRERRQKRTKLVSLQSEEEELESASGDMAATASGGYSEKGAKCVKEGTIKPTAISLSHLETEEEDT